MVNFRLEGHWYLDQKFTYHLGASDIRASEETLVDHPIWSFLDHLCQINYYFPVFNSDPHLRQIRHVWFVISATLRWVQRHQVVCLFSKMYFGNIYHLPHGPSAPQALEHAP
jgi:hypothetical protein